MHVQSTRSIGGTVINVDSVVNVPAKFIATQGTLLSTGFIDPTTKCDFKGHVSGTTLVIDGFEPGSTDTGSASGQVIIIKPNTIWANLVASFIMNATGNGTPENHTVAQLAATDVTTGTLEVSGAATFSGNASVAGTSWLVAQSTATINGSGQIIPVSQVYRVTALAGAATILTPTYTPQDGMTGELRIYDNGTAQSLTWATGWKGIGVTLPTTTTVGQFIYVSYEYSAVDSKYHVLSVARG
jgi:hypothetical protein